MALILPFADKELHAWAGLSKKVTIQSYARFQQNSVIGINHMITCNLSKKWTPDVLLGQGPILRWSAKSLKNPTTHFWLGSCVEPLPIGPQGYKMFSPQSLAT